MSGKIKCTYDGCFRHFATVESMKKHKAKDDAHEYYCKRCDYDAIDDNYLLFHQITSPKHISCPVCCREFRSEGGRDRHVEIDHIPKQNINCVGCSEHFDTATGLMHHIEHNECKVITSAHFYRQRAEKQILRDAWDAATDPTAGTTVLANSAVLPAAQAELTLLDDERAWIDTDWQGNPIHRAENEQSAPQMNELGEAMSELSITKYPPLGTGIAEASNVSHYRTGAASDLLDATRSSQGGGKAIPPAVPTAAVGAGVWSNRPPLHLGQSAGAKVPLSSNRSNVSSNLLEQSHLSAVDASVATWGTRGRTNLQAPTNSPYDYIHFPTSPPNTNSNAHVTTVSATAVPSSLAPQRFYDPISEMYVCPGRKCGGRYPTMEAFAQHMSSGPHVGSHVVCPGCLKRFKTTTALIAHCESGSRKCKVRHAFDYDQVIAEVTAGLIAADGSLEDGSVRYMARRIEDW